MTHGQRLAIADVDPGAYQAVLGMEAYVRAGKLEAGLLELVKIRASQINGCAFCLEMHNREAREHGEAQRRLDVLAGWREVPGLFTERERAALALTEVVTMIADAGVPDEIWDLISKQFTEQEIVHLLMAVATINVWNRLAVSTRQQQAEPAQ
jgi:AhpD family alkylhydroperoxidase